MGFRNVAIHDDQKLNLDIVQRIAVDHLDDVARTKSAIVITKDRRIRSYPSVRPHW